MISLFSSNNKNIKEAHATIAKLQGEVVELNKQIEDFKKASADLSAQLETMKAEHVTKIESLNKELEQAKTVTTEAVMKQASLKIESIGIKENEAHKPSVSSEVAYESAIARLKTLKGKEKTEYFKKNQGILTQPRHSLTQNNESKKTI